MINARVLIAGPATGSNVGHQEIGNKYKSEILFLSKINPFVTVKDIPSKVMKTLLRQIPSILRIGYMNAGMTRDLYKEPIGEMANTNNKKWSDRHWVFRRGGRPCWKCMTQIATDYKSSSLESLSGVLNVSNNLHDT